jgi:hypothetical protein
MQRKIANAEVNCQITEGTRANSLGKEGKFLRDKRGKMDFISSGKRKKAQRNSNVEEKRNTIQN